MYQFSIDAVTDYHKCNSLKQYPLKNKTKQYPFVISQICGTEVWHGIVEFSAQGLTKPKSGLHSFLEAIGKN